MMIDPSCRISAPGNDGCDNRGVARTISYADAVRILGGGPESPVYQRVNTMTGGLLAGAAIAAPQLLALLDLRTELARVSGELVTTTARAMAGSGRRDRTDRLPPPPPPTPV